MNNQRGSILISLLVMVTILSILSITVYRISYSANRQAQFTRDNSQAYYLAKAGADLAITNIEKIIDSNNKTLELDFPNEGKAIIDLKLRDDNKEISINSTGIVNEKKRNESKSSIQANLISKSNLGDIVILGVDNHGVIYEFNEEFENPEKIEIIDKEGKEINIKDPRSFAWDGGNKLVLVGGESGNKVDTLICDLTKGIWRKANEKSTGNGFRYVEYSKEKNVFYAINTNNDKINYLSENETWQDIHKPTANFKIEKLAQGNGNIVGISKNNSSEITYLKDENKEWEKKIINGSGMEGIYCGITFGNKKDWDKGRFVIVGYEKGKSYPIFIFSKDGIEWYKGNQINTMSGINYELNDVIWTGEKFVAVGNSGTIYTSSNGEDWYAFDRKDIIKDSKSTQDYWFNYSRVSGNGDYIIAFSSSQGGRLISTDGGKTWTEKEPIKVNDKVIKLKDIIVINKGDGGFDPKNYKIQWSK